MRIVLIDKDELLKVGGIGIFTNRLRKFLEKNNHEVFVLRFSNNKSGEKNTFHIPYYLANPQTVVFLPKEDSLSILKDYLITLKPDIVYTPIGLSIIDLFIASLCHEQKVPIAGVWHVDLNRSSSSYQLLLKSLFFAYTPICKQFDLLHVFSDKLTQFFVAKGISRKRILTLSNGVDTEIYRKKRNPQFRKVKKIKNGILFLGRMTLDKNPEILIKSFLSLNPNDNTKLVLVGPGDLEEYLKSEYKDKRILFTGLVEDEEEKIDIMSSCEIFVLPSRFEGMPLALLEAMSCRLACVASDAGSNAEVLGDSGIVLTHSQIKFHLPLALKMTLDFPILRNHLAEKARERILNNFSQEVIFKQLVTRLEDVAVNFKKSNIKAVPVDINNKIFRRIEYIWRKVKDYIIEE